MSTYKIKVSIYLSKNRKYFHFLCREKALFMCNRKELLNNLFIHLFTDSFIQVLKPLMGSIMQKKYKKRTPSKIGTKYRAHVS